MSAPAFTTAPQSLAGLLAPEDTDTFLRTCWGRNFRHVPGTPGKFSALLPWHVLNQILEQHRLEPPRLRLTQEGKPVPASRFLTYQQNRRKSGQPIPRLMSSQLTRELREGATLVLDAVDELHHPITELVESLERLFRVRVQVNAYAGWRTSHGFDLHWDDHDVFILQVAGRKHWKVYGMTRAYPLARDVEPCTDPPTVPLWDGLLEDGSLLYIPRGWWHVATPLDEPTLHLTVGVNNPTGADLLGWFVDRLRSSELVRRDLPHFGGAEEQREYAKGLLQVFNEEWTGDIIAEFLRDSDAKSTSRARLMLPWAATAEVLPDGWSFQVRWIGSRPAELVSREGEVSVTANARRWRFAPKAEPILQLLLSGREYSFEQLCEAVNETLDRDTVRSFVRELVTSGLVSVKPAA